MAEKLKMATIRQSPHQIRKIWTIFTLDYYENVFLRKDSNKILNEDAKNYSDKGNKLVNDNGLKIDAYKTNDYFQTGNLIYNPLIKREDGKSDLSHRFYLKSDFYFKICLQLFKQVGWFTFEFFITIPDGFCINLNIYLSILALGLRSFIVCR